MVFNLAHKLICDGCGDDSPKNSVHDIAHKTGWLFVAIDSVVTEDDTPDQELSFCPACAHDFLTVMAVFQQAQKARR
jgi:hypothetical protein